MEISVIPVATFLLTEGRPPLGVIGRNVHHMPPRSTSRQELRSPIKRFNGLALKWCPVPFLLPYLAYSDPVALALSMGTQSVDIPPRGRTRAVR